MTRPEANSNADLLVDWLWRRLLGPLPPGAQRPVQDAAQASPPMATKPDEDAASAEAKGEGLA